MSTALRYEGMSRAELLEAVPACTMTQTAFVLNLNHQRGRKAGLPDRQLAIQLVHRGVLPLVDPSQPVHRWTVSATNIRRYLNGNDGSDAG